MLLNFAPVLDQPPPFDQKWLLGSAGDADLLVRVKTSLVSDVHGVRTVDVRLVFTADKGTKTLRRFSRDLGQSFGGPTSLSIGPFLGLDRNQVLVSVTMGAVRSWVFDFDGQTLRTPYSRTSGRVDVLVAPAESGGWQIDELWPRLQYEDKFPGRPYELRSDGRVLRIVPLKRGPAFGTRRADRRRADHE